jgi:DNA-binding response OmpR family regulator
VSTPIRILVVDDSPLILAAATEALRGAGYTVESRTSVDDVATRGVSGFDLILMDVQMPELYGDDVAVGLRERGVTTPIYLFSSLPERELQTRVREAHVNGYIAKDRGVDHLLVEVEKIISSGYATRP